MPTTPTPGTTFWEQPALEQERSADDSRITVRYAGDWSDVSDYAAAFTIGAAHPTATGYELASVLLERYEGPSGRLTLVYSDTAAEEDSTSHTSSARVKKVAWSLVTTPCDVPIWRYCGPSDQNAKRYRLELWMAEQDPDLKSAFKYTAPDGTIRDLTVNDTYIAYKILQGYETVQRHYPTIRKITSLTKGDVTPDGELDHIKVGGPAGAPAYMLAFAASWLKTGEQIDVAEDGQQTLTEEWIGGEEFDANFYGDDPDRWEFGTI